MSRFRTFSSTAGSTDFGGILPGTSSGSATNTPDGYILSDGDNFNALSIVGRDTPQGDYFTTRAYTFPTGNQYLRANSSLLMYDVDPLHSGYANGGVNDNQPVASWADCMTVSGSLLRLKARVATSDEKEITQAISGDKRDYLGAMIHTAGRMVFRAPFIIEYRIRDLAGTGLDAHPSRWIKSLNPLRSWTGLEVDWEDTSVSANAYYYTDSNHTDSTGGGYFSSVLDGDFHTLAIGVSESGGTVTVDWYIDGTLKRTTTTTNAGVLSNLHAGHYALMTAHVPTSATLSDWQARGSDGYYFDVDWIRVWRSPDARHYTPLVEQDDINVDFDTAFSVVLPDAATVWGDATVDDFVAPIPFEENEPGGGQGGSYGTDTDVWPSGISYDASTRTLSGTISDLPGRLHIFRYALKEGATCKPQRFAINVGPHITASAMPDGVVGEAYTYTISAANIDVGRLAPAVITLTGTLPDGLTASTGADGSWTVSGTPTAAADASLTLTVTNTLGQSAEVALSVSVIERAAEVTVTKVFNAVSGTDQTIFTFSGLSFGAASSDRKIVVGVGSRASALRTISSVTVGGVTATSIAQTTSSSGFLSRTALFIADVPTGTSGDVVVTYSGTALRCTVGGWALTGAHPSTPVSASGTSTSDPASQTLNIPENGAAIGYGFAANGAPISATWSNLSEDFDEAVETNFTHSGASATSVSGGDTALTCDWSATPSIGAGVVFATFTR